MKPPFPPLTFAGKSFGVSHYIDGTDVGLQPAGFTDDQDEDRFPVAVLLSHFTHCYVLGIVRIIRDRNSLIVTGSGLDAPDAEPWFLIKAVKKGERTSGEFYFIVNGDYEFYPLKALNNDRRVDQQAYGLGFLPPEVWQQGHNWTTFSAVDKEGVEAAIQAYLARTGLR